MTEQPPIEPPPCAKQPHTCDGTDASERLKLLHEYTKWHNGIYLTLAGGFFALASTQHVNWPINIHPCWVVAAGAFMVVAGIAGGIIATSTLEHTTFACFMKSKLGPDFLMGCAIERRLPCGRRWTNIEHYAFWIGLACAGLALKVDAKPTSYRTQTVDATGNAVALCSKDQPQVAEYWIANQRHLTNAFLDWKECVDQECSKLCTPAREPSVAASLLGVADSLTQLSEDSKLPLTPARTQNDDGASKAKQRVASRYRQLFEDKYFFNQADQRHHLMPAMNDADFNRVEDAGNAWLVASDPPAGMALEARVAKDGSWTEIFQVRWAVE